MHINKIFINLSVWSVLLVACLYYVNEEQYFIILLATAALTIVLIVNANFDVTHPSIWFVFAINIYHLSICFLHLISFRFVEKFDEIILINFISLVSYGFAYLLSHRRVKAVSSIPYAGTVLKTFALVFFLFSIVIPISFILSGAKIKADFNNQFEFIFPLLHFFLALYIIKNKVHFKSWLVLLMAGYFLFISLLMGERNIFLSFVILVVFYSSRVFNVNNKKLIFTCLLVLLLIPVLGQFKNVFTKDSQSSNSADDFLPIISFFNGEFRSAGYNLNYILTEDVDFKYGASIVGDVLRSTVPGFIYKFENSILWYNKTYHSEIMAQGRGYGFSMAAEGYVNFGYFGVFIWMFCISYLLLWINNKSYEDEKWLAIYIISVPIFIYSMRGDISTILSPMLKQTMIPVLMVFIADRYLKYAFKK